MKPPTDTITQLDLLERSIVKLIDLAANGTNAIHLELATIGGRFVEKLLHSIDELPNDFFNDMPSETKKSMVMLLTIGSVTLIERAVLAYQDSQNELN